jgi:hypothetical protein
MQATSQEVQDKLGLLRKLMVSIRLLIETRQVLPLAKDRKSVELHGRNKSSSSTKLQLQTSSHRKELQCKERNLVLMVFGARMVIFMVVSKVFSASEHHRSLSHQK